jgi:hypothetical protein
MNYVKQIKTCNMTLQISDLTKGLFVLVETRNTMYEIGIVRESELQIGKKQLKILILTDADFEELPPVFDETWPPFLPSGTREVELDTHPLYPIETTDVISLLALQKLHLRQQLPDKKSEFDAFEEFENMLMNLCLNSGSK